MQFGLLRIGAGGGIVTAAVVSHGAAALWQVRAPAARGYSG
jgi:hypothetical protein